MTENNPNERKGMIVHLWLISLAVSVLCCALFSMMISFYVNDINKNLIMIANRLAGIEARAIAGMAPPAPVVQPAPATEATPPVDVNVDVPGIPDATPPAIPGAEPAAPEPTPAPAPTSPPPVEAPSAAPAPDAATPAPAAPEGASATPPTP